MDTPEPQELPTELFEELSEKFYALRQHRMRQTDVSSMLDFLGDDVIMSMMEALADIANMCDMQFIKLALLQGYLSDDLKEKGVTNEGGGIGIGLQAFQRASDVWKEGKS